MASTWRRIAIAATVSITGCGLTYLWHIQTVPKSIDQNESEIIAFIAQGKNEINRKGSRKALWEPAEALDRLRTGDSIRTSSNAEARIQFYHSNRYIDLEPESMIVIQSEKSEINLELLEGSLFVQGSDDEMRKDTLTLKSQSGKIDLSQSSAQLSGSSSKKIDLKILKGSAKYISENNTVENLKEGSEGGIGTSGLRLENEKIKILSPSLTRPFFTNAAAPEPIVFQWTGFPQGALIQLYSGSNRKNLFPSGAEALQQSQLQILWTPGIYYWKLAAIDPQTQKSLLETPTYRTEVIGRHPPSPLSPEPNFVIQTRRTSETITLKWNTPKDTKQVLIEVFNDRSKAKILSQQFSPSESSHTLQNLPLGTYSWTLTAYPTDGQKPIKSPLHQFFINEKRVVKIPITWNESLEETQFFVNTNPKLTLMWDPDQTERAKKWKISIAPEGTPLNQGISAETQQIKLEKMVPKPGRYMASIEAFDEEGDLIGSALPKSFHVAPLPLLPAPTLNNEDEEQFIARPDGSFPLQWQEVSEAVSYQVSLQDNSGKLLNQYTTRSRSFSLANLMPGTYRIQVNAVDQHGRRGAPANKPLTVPDKSELKAPKIRSLKVN